MKVHERVRQIRVSKGIQQSFVARELRLTVPHWNRIELGKNPLRAELITPLAKILNVNPGDFFELNLDDSSK